MNVELLERIAAAIEAKPKLYDQTDWIRSTPCGTVCCIAGWAAELSDPTFARGYEQWLRGDGKYVGSVADRAEELLMLPEWSAGDLFDANGFTWPGSYGPEGNAPTAAEAVRLLRAIAKGDVVWDETEEAWSERSR